MKRLFLSVIMVLGLSTVCFSQNKQEINDLNIEIPLPKLARYLNLNSIQYDNVENAIDFFSLHYFLLTYLCSVKQNNRYNKTTGMALKRQKNMNLPL